MNRIYLSISLILTVFIATPAFAKIDSSDADVYMSVLEYASIVFTPPLSTDGIVLDVVMQTQTDGSISGGDEKSYTFSANSNYQSQLMVELFGEANRPVGSMFYFNLDGSEKTLSAYENHTEGSQFPVGPGSYPHSLKIGIRNVGFFVPADELGKQIGVLKVSIVKPPYP